MQVKPHLLYKPDLVTGNSMPDEQAVFRLFDRVVNVREGFSVPLGLRGTVTGIAKTGSAPTDELLLDVLFDRAFPGGLSLRSSPGRSYRVPSSGLINLTYGQFKGQGGGQGHAAKNKKPTAIVTPLGGEATWGAGGAAERGKNQRFAKSQTPPDPSNLPDPTKLFGNSSKTNKKKSNNQQAPRQAQQVKQHQPQQQQPQQAINFQDMWQQMNQGGIHPPPMPTMGAASLPPVVAGPSGGPSAEEMTQSLQSMILGAKQQPKQQPKPSAAPSPQKSQCQLLNEILQKRNLGLARYAHNASPDGRIFATCTMPWGAKFESRSAAETPDRASEFAAFQALAHLRNNGFPKKGKTPAKDKQQPQSAVAFVPTQVKRSHHAGEGVRGGLDACW